MNYPAQECDIWWHLQIGEDILKEHRWPSPDSYSYVSGGREWVVHSWLADCIFYVLYSLFGFTGLTVFRYLTHFILAFGVFRICTRGLLKPEYGLCVALLTLYLVWDREIRPFLFSEIAFLLFYIFVRNPSPSRKVLLGIPFLFLFWINTHPLALLICVYLLFFYILSLFCIAVTRVHPAGCGHFLFPNTYWYGASFTACVFSSIHPEPLSLLNRFIQAPRYRTNDWKSPILYFIDHPADFLPYMIILVITVLLLFYALIRHVRSGNPLSLSEWSFAFFCIIVSFLYIRTMWIIIFPLTTAILTLPRFKINARFSHQSHGWIPLILYVILQFSRMQLPSEPYFPREAMDFWNTNQMLGNIYCDWTWSGYVLWSSNKTAKTFVDTRIEPFHTDLFPYAPVHPSKLVHDLPSLIHLKTEYLLLPLPSCHPVSIFMDQNGLAKILFQNDKSILLKLNTDRYLPKL